MKSELVDRILWYDGSIEIEPDNMCDFILRGVPLDKIYVSTVTDEIRQFNSMSGENVSVKLFSNELDKNWLLPDEFANLNIDEYFELIKQTLDNSDPQYDQRLTRIDNELSEFKRRELIMMLKTIIYITHTFKEKNVLWGIGRGSSCASYLLYLVGLHCVDPIKYNIPMSEFLHD